MRSRLLTFCALLTIVSCSIPDNASAQRRRRVYRTQAPVVQQVDNELPTPQPAPEPVPDDATPPDGAPEPDPAAPAPEVTPAPQPAPAPTPVITIEDPISQNAYIAGKLGGYVRANHATKGGNTVDIYQARGKQRVVWRVAPVDKWIVALGESLAATAIAGADKTGIALITEEPLPDYIKKTCQYAGVWLVSVKPSNGAVQYLIYADKVVE